MIHQLKTRMKVQSFTDWEILEEHTDIFEASNREIQLQKDYSLPVDKIPYWKTLENGELGGWSQNAWDACSIANTGRIPEHINNIEHQSKAGKKGGLAISTIIRVCPNCEQEIKGRVYFNSHGDKCKVSIDQRRDIKNRYSNGEKGLCNTTMKLYGISRSLYYKIIA